MEGSDSHLTTPNRGKTPYGVVCFDDFILRFGNFGLRKDGTLQLAGASASQCDSVSWHGSDSHGVFSTLEIREEDAANEYTNSNEVKNPLLFVQETSDRTTQRFPGNSVTDHHSLWGYHYFMNGGEGFPSNMRNYVQESLMGTVHYDDRCSNLYNTQNFAAGSSSGQSTIKSLCDWPSTSNYLVDQLNGGPLLYDRTTFTGRDKLENYLFSKTENNGLYYGDNDDAASNDLSTSSWLSWNRQGSVNFAEKGTQIDFKYSLEILRGRDQKKKEVLICMLRGSYFMLMINKQTHSLFQALVDACEGERLDLLVGEILSKNELFLDAAFYSEGQSSIVKLIRKLKKSLHAFTLTQILSTRFWDIMTHYIARIVIQQCLIVFGNGPNKVLYEKAILHSQDLAVHKVGCRSLNECIASIAGKQRSRLLDRIADVSDYLSHDPYGNFVVQNVLSLKNPSVTSRIVCRLQKQFLQLAQKQGGSHVVEKCMEASDTGLLAVVQEITNTPGAPFLLAQHQFGNYVIQKALDKTKKQGFRSLHQFLVISLELHSKELNRTAGGKSVMNILKSERSI